MQDNFIHKGRRKRMIDLLRARFPFDEQVLEAMYQIPRHFFVDSALEHLAYEDRPLAIHAGQTISQPCTVALQTHLLQIHKREKVLEVGTGCGYQTAVLAALGAKVHTIERQKELYLQAQQNLYAVGLQALFSYGDGYAGKPLLAPFDKIIITCGAPALPEQLLTQLAIGGRMVVPVGDSHQVMTVARRLSDKDYQVTTHGHCRFVPMLEGKT